MDTLTIITSSQVFITKCIWHSQDINITIRQYLGTSFIKNLFDVKRDKNTFRTQTLLLYTFCNNFIAHQVVMPWTRYLKQHCALCLEIMQLNTFLEFLFISIYMMTITLWKKRVAIFNLLCHSILDTSTEYILDWISIAVTQVHGEWS